MLAAQSMKMNSLRLVMRRQVFARPFWLAYAARVLNSSVLGLRAKARRKPIVIWALTSPHLLTE